MTRQSTKENPNSLDDGLTLGSGDYVSPNVWQKVDEATGKTFTYLLTDWTENGQTFKRLSIQRPDGGLWVKGWQNGQFGISLPGAPADTQPRAQTTQRTILGDLAPVDFEPDPGIQTRSDELGNVIIDPGQSEPNRADTLYDSAGDDLIQSGGGADIIRAIRGGKDHIEAGAGNDWVSAGAGEDHVEGGDDARRLPAGNRTSTKLRLAA